MFTLNQKAYSSFFTLSLGKPGLCKQMNPVNGSMFMRHLLNVSFLSYSQNLIAFNSNGDPPGRFVCQSLIMCKSCKITVHDIQEASVSRPISSLAIRRLPLFTFIWRSLLNRRWVQVHFPKLFPVYVLGSLPTIILHLQNLFLIMRSYFVAGLF